MRQRALLKVTQPVRNATDPSLTWFIHLSRNIRQLMHSETEEVLRKNGNSQILHFPLNFVFSPEVHGGGKGNYPALTWGLIHTPGAEVLKSPTSSVSICFSASYIISPTQSSEDDKQGTEDGPALLWMWMAGARNSTSTDTQPFLKTGVGESPSMGIQMWKAA